MTQEVERVQILESSTLQILFSATFRPLPEVIDFAVGMSAKAGAVVEAEVVLQDGGNQAGKTWVSGKHCQVETVLAIAIGVIEADAFRRVAEPIGLFLGVEVDDRDVLVHRPAVLLVAADGDVQIFVAFGFAQVGGDEAAFVGEGDALEVIGQGFADDVGDFTNVPLRDV